MEPMDAWDVAYAIEDLIDEMIRRASGQFKDVEVSHYRNKLAKVLQEWKGEDI